MRLISYFLFAFVLNGNAAPVTLLQSDFTGNAPAQNLPWTNTSVIDSSITFSGWTIGPGIEAKAIDDGLGFSVTTAGTDLTIAESLSFGNYFSCSVQSANATPLNLNGLKISIDFRRITYFAPTQYAFMTSVDGFTAGQEVHVTPMVQHGDHNERHFSFILPSTGYDAINGNFEIRVVPINGRFGNHNALITGFSLITGVPTHTLTVNSGSGGSATAIPSVAVIEQGQPVQLSATPDPGYRFAGWTGDVQGFGNPRTVVMDANKVVTGNFSPLPPPGMKIGTNLNAVTDYSPSWVFKDLFKRIRTWTTRNADQSGAWDSGLNYRIPLDADGWPTEVPFDPGTGDALQMVHTILVVANEPGAHTLSYEGMGNFNYRADSHPWQSITATGPASLPLMISQGDNVVVEITSTAPPPNHLRNFKIVPNEFVGTSEAEPFHPQFVDRSKDFDVLRFMDWGQTNNSPLSDWADRTRPEHPTQSRSQGASLEYIVALSNLQGSDAWICIPHLADDNYVTQAATFLRDNLDPNLRVYVEYSNETWNPIFFQSVHVQDRGEALSLDFNRWEAGHKYTSLRSAEIWSIFETVYGAASSTRVVKVLGTQSGNISVTNSRLAALNDPAINPNFVFADALAIAPYFGRNYFPADIPPLAAAYPTVDEVVVGESIATIAVEAGRVAAQKAAADLQGISLICYEGGQHFVAIGEAQNDPTLTAVLTDANRDPRMYLRYREYLDMLEAEGVTVFANFALCGQFTKFGSWGVMEAIDQPLDAAVKYSAILDWMAENTRGEKLFQISNFQKNGNDLDITWRSKPAHRYKIETSSDLNTWVPGPSAISSQGLSTSYTLPGVGSTFPFFFRVAEEKP